MADLPRPLPRPSYRWPSPTPGELHCRTADGGPCELYDCRKRLEEFVALEERAEKRKAEDSTLVTPDLSPIPRGSPFEDLPEREDTSGAVLRAKIDDLANDISTTARRAAFGETNEFPSDHLPALHVTDQEYRKRLEVEEERRSPPAPMAVDTEVKEQDEVMISSDDLNMVNDGELAEEEKAKDPRLLPRENPFLPYDGAFLEANDYYKTRTLPQPLLEGKWYGFNFDQADLDPLLRDIIRKRYYSPRGQRWTSIRRRTLGVYLCVDHKEATGKEHQQRKATGLCEHARLYYVKNESLYFVEYGIFPSTHAEADIGIGDPVQSRAFFVTTLPLMKLEDIIRNAQEIRNACWLCKNIERVYLCYNCRPEKREDYKFIMLEKGTHCPLSATGEVRKSYRCRHCVEDAKLKFAMSMAKTQAYRQAYMPAWRKKKREEEQEEKKEAL